MGNVISTFDFSQTCRLAWSLSEKLTYPSFFRLEPECPAPSLLNDINFRSISFSNFLACFRKSENKMLKQHLNADPKSYQQKLKCPEE